MDINALKSALAKVKHLNFDDSIENDSLQVVYEAAKEYLGVLDTYSKYMVCWRQDKSVGVIVDESGDAHGLCREFRKGACNPYDGVVSNDFMEAWAHMTVNDDNICEPLLKG